MQKIQRGGGTSLKFRGKSEEVRVGGSSSSWRFGRLFSFVLGSARRIFLAAVATTATLSANADQYWVGGTSGLWSGDNWATEAGGTGGAWTSGNMGWFTTSPSIIDLAGSSQSATRFKTTGFSAANRCVVNITNSSETASTLTFSGLNRNSDNDFAFTDLIVRNVAVSDASTWGFELTSGSHVYFGRGSSYTKPSANSNGSLYVGMFSATSNTITVAEGATMNVNGNAYIGCSRNDTEVACTGVVHVADGTLNVAGVLYMARSTSNNKTKNAGTGALVVDDGGTVNITGNIEIGSVYQKNHTHNSKADIIVNRGGVLNCAKFIAWEYANKGRKVSIDGGTFNCTGNFESGYASSGLYKSRDFTVEVKNDGVLALGGNFFPNSYNGAKEKVTFDNGTLRALANFSTIYSSAGDGDYTDFKIGAGGMTIDTQGYTMTWTTRIDESEGKVTKTGSGKFNLNWTAYNYGGFDVDEGTLSFGGSSTSIANGPLTVKSGATLEKQTGNNPSSLASSVTFKDGAKLSVPYSGGAVGAVVANAITVEGSLDVSFSAVPAEGAYPLLTITGEGTFDEGVLSRINKPEGDAYAGALFALSADEKSVMLILSSDPVWIGGKSGNLGDPTKWSTGVVPGDGANAVITAAAAATLTNSAAFKATTITFPAGCPKVTIEGDFSGITQIANNSSSMVEFTGAVAFADNVDVVQNSGAVKFTGGATGTQLASATDIHGKYTFTKTEDHTEIAGTVVKSDGVYNLPNGCFYNNAGGFSVEEGGIAVVKSTEENGGPDNSYVYLAQSIAGTFVATDEIFSGKKPQNSNLLGGTGGAYLEKSSGGGVFFANKVRVANGGLLIAPQKIAIGSGGILRGDGIVRVQNNGSHYFGSLANWSMYKSGEADSADPILIKYNSTSSSCVLTFDTRNYTNDAAQVITCKAPICAVNADTASTLSAIVKGNGTFSFECSYNDNDTDKPKWFSGGLIVQDTATVEVKANAKPGKGTITLGAGTTLALTAESREFTPLANTLKLPTEGTATLRIDGRRLRHGEHEIASDVTGESENVKLDGKSSALAGRKATLRVDGGKLYLTIKPDGTMIIVR